MCNRISPVPSILSSLSRLHPTAWFNYAYYIIFRPVFAEISALIRGMSASNVFLTLASNVLSHVVFPLLEITKPSDAALPASFDISRSAGKLSLESASVVIHALVPSLTRSPLYTRFRLVCGIEWYNSNLAISSRLARLTRREVVCIAAIFEIVSELLPRRVQHLFHHSISGLKTLI